MAIKLIAQNCITYYRNVRKHIQTCTNRYIQLARKFTLLYNFAYSCSSWKISILIRRITLSLHLCIFLYHLKSCVCFGLTLFLQYTVAVKCLLHSAVKYSTFPFQCIIIFQTYQSLEPPSIPREDKHR